LRLRVDATTGVQVTTGQSYDPGWVATVDGRSLGSAQPLDTLSGWQVEAPGPHEIVMRYTPQHRFRLALLLTALTLLLCVLLVVPRPRRWQRATPARPRPRPDAARRGDAARTGVAAWSVTAAAIVGAVAAGFVILGVPGAVVAGAAAVAARRGTPDVPLAGAVVLLAVAALATVLEAPVTSSAIRPVFALERPIATWAAGLAAVLALIGIAWAAFDASDVDPQEEAQP
jgi:hypothetical protein